MLILSNGFPTNLPDSDIVSQGGPANFARLFINYILSSGAEHKWVGVMLEGSNSRGIYMEEVFASTYRRYYRLRAPKAIINKVTQAKSSRVKPVVAWKKPIAALVSLIEEQKPDVVFLNGFGVFNWMLLQAAKETNTPVVIQHAGIWTKELGIHKDRYTEQGRKLLERMEQDSTELSSIEIFLNTWSREYYATHVASGDARKTEIVPLPFDFTSFKQLHSSVTASKFSFSTKKFHVGIIARWDEIKNHAAVLALAKAARAQKLPWQFHAIVDIPASEDAATVQEYKKYVDVIPPVDRAGISAFCSAVDLLLLPSLFDVSPTVVLEAVALKTPIVISETVGYVRDFASHGAAEWVIDPSDVAQSLENLKNIMGKEMPADFTNYIVRAHNHTQVFATYLELFEIAKLKSLPMPQVVRKLFRKELGKYLPFLTEASQKKKEKVVSA